jgi:hypothetical protein
VRRMSAAVITEFLQFEALRRALFVFRRSVVPMLALRTFKRDDFPHNPYRMTNDK